MNRPPAYARMLAARDVVRNRLNALEFQLLGEAESAVSSPAAHRGDSGWRKSDERQYQDALANLRHRHRKDLGALRAKLDRQQSAIRARVTRNGR